MPQGKGTYGKQVGRPPMKKKMKMNKGGATAMKKKMMYGGSMSKKK
jgi:hypothetical protein|tara:strand:- start:137 stop:274 length:138 start_codon:yes stop_codon:yes gene_type:complete